MRLNQHIFCKKRMGNARPTAPYGARQTAAAHADILCKDWCEIYRAPKSNEKHKIGESEGTITLNDSVESSVEKYGIE